MFQNWVNDFSDENSFGYKAKDKSTPRYTIMTPQNSRDLKKKKSCDA